MYLIIGDNNKLISAYRDYPAATEKFEEYLNYVKSEKKHRDDITPDTSAFLCEVGTKELFKRLANKTNTN